MSNDLSLSGVLKKEIGPTLPWYFSTISSLAIALTLIVVFVFLTAPSSENVESQGWGHFALLVLVVPFIFILISPLSYLLAKSHKIYAFLLYYLIPGLFALFILLIRSVEGLFYY